MIQVASCERALIKTKRIPIQEQQSRAYTLEFEFDKHISSTWLAIGECRVSFPCFLLVNSALSRLLPKNDCLVKPNFSYFFNYKNKEQIKFGQNMIISSYVLITNQLYFDSSLFIKLKT